MTRLAALALIAILSPAAEFQTGQSAWAVVGQASFTAAANNLSPVNLTLLNSRLYIADASEPRRNRLLVMDTRKLPDIHEDFEGTPSAQCGACGFSPIPAVEQGIPQVPPTISVFGPVVAIIDAKSRAVLVWKNFYKLGRQAPDVVLGRNKGENGVISGNTLVDPVSVAVDGHRIFVGDAALHRVLVWNSFPSFGDQPADAVLGQAGFSDALPNLTGPAAIGVPAALASDGMRLFVADPAHHRVLVFVPGETQLAADAIVNSASLYSDPVAPGTLVEIRGPALSELDESAPDEGVRDLPVRLANVEVICDGNAIPLLSVSGTKIRAQIPYTLADNSAASLYVRTAHPDGTVTITNARTLRIAPATPGLFAAGKKEPRGGLLIHAEESSPSGVPVSAETPARAGEQIIVWATGLGLVRDVNPSAGLLSGSPYSGSAANEAVQSVSAFVDGKPAKVLSAALPPGAIGVYQIRILLPADLAPHANAVLSVTQDGYTSNAVTFPLQAVSQ